MLNYSVAELRFFIKMKLILPLMDISLIQQKLQPINWGIILLLAFLILIIMIKDLRV